MSSDSMKQGMGKHEMILALIQKLEGVVKFK